MKHALLLLFAAGLSSATSVNGVADALVAGGSGGMVALDQDVNVTLVNVTGRTSGPARSGFVKIEYDFDLYGEYLYSGTGITASFNDHEFAYLEGRYQPFSESIQDDVLLPFVLGSEFNLRIWPLWADWR